MRKYAFFYQRHACSINIVTAPAKRRLCDSKNLALLAAFWRLAECSILALITWNDLVALRLLNGANYLRA
jgi:hypothetical protein